MQFLHFYINFGGIIVNQINGSLKNVISKKHTIPFDQNISLSYGWRSESGLLLTVRNAFLLKGQKEILGMFIREQMVQLQQ